ncbi:MAG TPA: MarR family winged helix-turn-helix transcriptional regulator [Thermomicrobiales bacterium]|nr:MarR family winged helix-turn-helix transcriptional regulator [Thermomicrobiales bacterium]
MAEVSEKPATKAAGLAANEDHWTVAADSNVQTADAVLFRDTINSLLLLLPTIIRRMGAIVGECPAGYNPTLAQKRVMCYVAVRGKATVSQIAEALDMSRPGASEMIDRMVEIGYVMRESNPADRRQVLISLTPDAATIVDALTSRRREVLIESLGDLDNEELRGFLKGMHGMARVLAPDYSSEVEAVSLRNCPTEQ